MCKTDKNVIVGFTNLVVSLASRCGRNQSQKESKNKKSDGTFCVIVRKDVNRIIIDYDDKCLDAREGEKGK